MLTIELEPDTQQLLDTIAQNEHSSPSELIKRLINLYIQEKQQSELLIDRVATLPEIACFKGQDPLEIQKAMRDEWD